MVEGDEAAIAAAKKSWRFRRQMKRLFFAWLVPFLLIGEVGASWFGIFLSPCSDGDG
jgi:hypothetical protein